jgi:hypothetical protein
LYVRIFLISDDRIPLDGTGVGELQGTLPPRSWGELHPVGVEHHQCIDGTRTTRGKQSLPRDGLRVAANHGDTLPIELEDVGGEIDAVAETHTEVPVYPNRDVAQATLVDVAQQPVSRSMSSLE